MQDFDKVIQQIEELIINDRLDESIKKLKSIFEAFQDEDLINETILLLSRLNNYKRKLDQGVVDTFDLEYGKARLAIINLKSTAKKLITAGQQPKVISPGPAPAPSEPVSNVIFEDYFVDNSQEWPVGDNKDYAIKIRNSRMTFEHKRDVQAWQVFRSVNIDYTRDFSIKTRITFLDGVETNGYGLSWGGNGEGNYFYFVVSPNGYFTIKYHFEDQLFTLAEWTENPVVKRGKATNILEVVKKGEMMHFKLNNQVVFSSEFVSFFGDEVGMEVNQRMKVAIDLFRVTN